MKILFDNYNYGSCCRSLWGFSLYLKKYKLLFDTGSNGRVLLENIKKMDIDISEIKYLFVTHSHWDHIGGIDSILEINTNLILFVPNSLSKYLIADLKNMAKEIIICDDKPMRLFDEVYTTGLIGKKMPEQSLIIADDTPKVITGCGHSGIVKIATVAKDVIKSDIDVAIGGFHLMDKGEGDILSVIKSLKNLGINKVIPTHCTGDIAIELFKKHFKDNYIQGGVGKNISI